MSFAPAILIIADDLGAEQQGEDPGAVVVEPHHAGRWRGLQQGTKYLTFHTEGHDEVRIILSYCSGVDAAISMSSVISQYPQREQWPWKSVEGVEVIQFTKDR